MNENVYVPSTTGIPVVPYVPAPCPGCGRCRVCGWPTPPLYPQPIWLVPSVPTVIC